MNKRKKIDIPDKYAQENGYKYTRFGFRTEWLKFIEDLPTPKEQSDTFHAVSEYGLKEAEPQGLTPEAMEYFNNEIRPDLDRQHKRINEGKRIL